PPPRGKRRRSRAEPAEPPPCSPPLPALSPAPLSELRPGPNPRRALIGRVLFTCSPEGRVPYAVGLADGAGGVAALTVYNAAPDWGVAVGDAVAVPRPCLKHHVHQHHGQVRGGDGGCGGALWVRTGLYWSELVLPPLIPPRRRSPSRGCGFRRRSHSSSTGAAPRAPRWPLRASCCALTPRRLRPPRPDQSAAAVAALRRRLRLKGAMAGAVLGGGSVGAAILGETVEEEAAILEQAAGSVEGAMLGGSMGAAILGEVFVLQ
uniref:Tetratricopeptide repeat protein 5 OB fold domain-containing protein n=1 Tax=Strigops habroptila TaxID=2489341 RepID=A0A672UTW5_STRHB